MTAVFVLFAGNDLRDFRLTNDTDVLSTLKTAFDSLSDRYVWSALAYFLTIESGILRADMCSP